jgi:hypothetical protein
VEDELGLKNFAARVQWTLQQPEAHRTLWVVARSMAERRHLQSRLKELISIPAEEDDGLLYWRRRASVMFYTYRELEAAPVIQLDAVALDARFGQYQRVLQRQLVQSGGPLLLFTSRSAPKEDPSPGGSDTLHGTEATG